MKKLIAILSLLISLNSYCDTYNVINDTDTDLTINYELCLPESPPTDCLPPVKAVVKQGDIYGIVPDKTYYAAFLISFSYLGNIYIVHSDHLASLNWDNIFIKDQAGRVIMYYGATFVKQDSNN